MDFIEILKKRRSIYTLGKNINVSQTEILEIINDCVKYTPSAFNFPTTNIIIAFNDKHEQIWNITASILQEKLAKKPDFFVVSKAKIDKFKSGVGTILFYEDQDIINELKETYAMYADNFKTWSNQANGMLQINLWNTLANVNIGANLQHYNPLIDDKLKELFEIKDTWKLTAQMPFGNIEEFPKEKYIEDLTNRIKVY